MSGGWREDIGEFLRSRRALLRPEDVGLPGGGRRRVAGLRREELAIVAGVSPDHYQRIEQGRARPSWQVVDALAAALRLSHDERDYLGALARRDGPRAEPLAERLPPRLRLLLDSLHEVPAYVLNHRRDVLGWNSLGTALICDFGALPRDRRNIVKLMFLDQAVRDRYPEWESTARGLVSHLRHAVGSFGDDAKLAALIAELTAASPDFARLYHLQEVAEKAGGTKLLRHPVVGELAMEYQSLRINGYPNLELMTYLAPDERARDALRLLGTWWSTRSTAGR